MTSRKVFYEIYDHGIRDEAEKAFDARKASILEDPFYDPSRTVAKTVESFREPIFNHWDSDGLTHAFTECENSIIRATDRLECDCKFTTLGGGAVQQACLGVSKSKRGQLRSQHSESCRVSASKDKGVPIADMRLADTDLEEQRWYDSPVIETENGTLVDLETREV